MRSDMRIGTLDFFMCPHEYNNYHAKAGEHARSSCIDDGTSSKFTLPAAARLSVLDNFTRLRAG
jgi:hypothetical protein